MLKNAWGYGSVGRAMRSQCIGQGFESPYLHQQKKIGFSLSFFCLRKVKGIRTRATAQRGEKVAGGKFLATDRSNLQNISMNFGKMLCKLQERIPLSPPRKDYPNTAVSKSGIRIVFVSEKRYFDLQERMWRKND